MFSTAYGTDEIVPFQKERPSIEFFRKLESRVLPPKPLMKPALVTFFSETRALYLCTLSLLAVVLALYLPLNVIFMASIASAGCFLLMFIIAKTMNGSVDQFLLVWILCYPLGYYFFSFPREKSLVTFDRVILVILAGGMLFGYRRLVMPTPKLMMQAGLVWGLFLAAALTSTTVVAEKLSSIRLAIDAFLLPALLACFLFWYFPVRRNLSKIHVMTCIMATYAAVMAMIEVITGEDLLFLPGANFYNEAQTGELARANGPFSSANSCALIGLMSVVFLIFLRRAMPPGFPIWRRILHVIGVASALVMALLPAFRSVIVSMFVVLILEFRAIRRMRTRAVIVAYSVIFIAAVLSLRMAIPLYYENRVSDPSNIYGRIAQQWQTIELFMTHPLGGVGLSNYAIASGGATQYVFHGVYSANGPHNNFGAVLAETGLFGFIPYLLAQIFFFRAFWQLRSRRTPKSALAWKFFLYSFLVYWINGMALTSGYYSDLNLWYMFALTVMYKFALEPAEQVSHSRVRDAQRRFSFRVCRPALADSL